MATRTVHQGLRAPLQCPCWPPLCAFPTPSRPRGGALRRATGPTLTGHAEVACASQPTAAISATITLSQHPFPVACWKPMRYCQRCGVVPCHVDTSLTKHTTFVSHPVFWVSIWLQPASDCWSVLSVADEQLPGQFVGVQLRLGYWDLHADWVVEFVELASPNNMNTTGPGNAWIATVGAANFTTAADLEAVRLVRLRRLPP